MPPLLALLLCTVFVLYLLRTDKPTDYPVSVSLWLPTLWLLYCGSRQLVYWFGGDAIISDNGSTSDEGSQIDRLFLSILIILAFVALARRGMRWNLVYDRNRWLVTLYSYCFISILWSDVPFSSLKRFVRLAGAVLMALVILTEQSPRQALGNVFKRVVYVLIPFSLVLIKYFPNYGVAYRAHSGGKSWVGVTLSKNQLGILCVLSAFFLVWNFFTLRKEQQASRSLLENSSYVLVFGLCLFMMFGEGAYSATALTCLPAGLVTFCLLRWARGRRSSVPFKMLLIPVIMIFLVGASLPFLGTSPVAGVTGLLGRDATLTQRTDIWDILRPFAVEAPLLGHGYAGFWTNKTVAVADVNEAHNGYLEVLLILGVIGLALLFGFLISYCVRVHRNLQSNRDAPWAIFGFSLLVMLILHEATEASFLAETDLLWTSMIFLSLNYPSVDEPQTVAWEGSGADASILTEEEWVESAGALDSMGSMPGTPTLMPIRHKWC